MLTPVDIQQKKFHVGLGYDKKDVNTFFDSVSESYESLYRSNAELKEKVSILNDTLQSYRSKESHLEKSLKRAEKDTEETISNATKEAKAILRDAKIQAGNIVADAEKHLEKLEDDIVVLEARYEAYKSNFCALLKKQFEFLGEQDFDPDSMIDDRAFSLLGGQDQPKSASVSDNFGAYTGDPQMRDESMLGGFGGGYGSGDVTSTSAVYTQNLSAGDNFVDPFKKAEEEKEYNPFESKNTGSEKKSSLKVSDSAEERKKMKRATVGSSEASAAMQKAKEVSENAAKAATTDKYNGTTADNSASTSHAGTAVHATAQAESASTGSASYASATQTEPHSTATAQAASASYSTATQSESTSYSSAIQTESASASYSTTAQEEAQSSTAEQSESTYTDSATYSSAAQTETASAEYSTAAQAEAQNSTTEQPESPYTDSAAYSTTAQPEAQSSTTAQTASEEPVTEIPTILSGFGTEDNSDAEQVEGEVEDKKKNGPALIGDGEDDSDTDENGFEFV